MKKYLLHVALLLCCTLSFCVLPAVGQAVPDPYRKAADTLEKEPTGNGAKVFLKCLKEELGRWSEKREQARIPQLRQELLLTLAVLANKEGKAFVSATDMVFTEAATMAQSGDDPLVMYNAILLLGDLNLSQKKGEKVVPYSKAMPILIKIAASDQPALRIAALKGLARHAKYCSRAEDREALAKVFMGFAFAPLAKGEANEAAETQWARLISLEALGDLRTPGKNGEIAVKLFESASRQNKALESPFFRRDMARRLTAAQAFAKLNLTPEVLKAMGKKPEEIASTFTKFFLMCMKYEYDTDYYLQEMMDDETGRQAVYTPSTEDEPFQIRLWKQRTKAISSVFAWIYNDKNSGFKVVCGDVPNYAKIAKAIRNISMMYDRLGLKKRSRSSAQENESGEVPPEEMDSMVTSTTVSLYQMQRDMRKSLVDLANEAGIPVEIRVKKRPQSEMGY